MGNGAVERILASAFIAFGSAGLVGCAPQSTSGFQTVADPSPSAAAIQRQPSQTATVVPASTQRRRRQARRPKTPARMRPQPNRPRLSCDSRAHPTSDYRVRAGDVLEINVFQLQDFNREAPVDAAGTIGLPLIGAVPVAG